MICATVCRLLLIVLPLPFVQIVFQNGWILGVRSPPQPDAVGSAGLGCWLEKDFRGATDSKAAPEWTACGCY
jgi:hypothetical protein